jgi:hypothetical protein
MINQSIYSLAIGYQAGIVNQVTNSVILNAGGTPLNAGTTGLFIQPIRFTEQLPIAFGLQGLRGRQGGLQGFQGFQGYQGFQGVVGSMGGTGIPGGSNENIQYNVLGEFRGSSDLTYSSGTNTFTFGAGRTGGAFEIVGGVVQGTQPGTVRTTDTIKLVNAIDGKRFIECGADAPHTSYIDFHSNDGGPGVAWDGFIFSAGGSTAASGAGTLVFDNQLSSNYFFIGTTSTLTLNGNLVFGNADESTDRPTTPITEIIASGTLTHQSGGASENQRLFAGLTGGTFNVMACTPAGAFNLQKFWAYKNGGAGTFSFASIAGTSSTSGVDIVYNNTDNLISIYFTNTAGALGTVMSYTIIQSISNPNY